MKERGQSVVVPKVPKLLQVVAIAGENLICPLSNLDNDRTGLARSAGNKVHRDAGRICIRFILMPDHCTEVLYHGGFVNQCLVMIRTESLGHKAGVVEFIVVVYARTQGGRSRVHCGGLDRKNRP